MKVLDYLKNAFPNATAELDQVAADPNTKLVSALDADLEPLFTDQFFDWARSVHPSITNEQATLQGAFDWSETQQGVRYWSDISEAFK